MYPKPQETIVETVTVTLSIFSDDSNLKVMNRLLWRLWEVANAHCSSSVILRHGSHHFSPFTDNFRGSGIHLSILN